MTQKEVTTLKKLHKFIFKVREMKDGTAHPTCNLESGSIENVALELPYYVNQRSKLAKKSEADPTLANEEESEEEEEILLER